MTPPNPARRLIIAVAKRIFSPGERAAILSLISEINLSRFHRRGMARLRHSSWSRPERLNLGCGKYTKSGYLNVDLVPRGADLTLDLRRGLPFDDQCCSLIVSEHFFEHIDYPEPITHLLSDCFRVLKPGGILSFSVPDSEWPLTDYAKGADAPYFLDRKAEDWWPKYCTTRMEHINFHFRQGGEHRFSYDEETMKKLLEGIGFSDVHRRPFDPEIDSEHRRIGSLFISAKRPG